MQPAFQEAAEEVHAQRSLSFLRELLEGYRPRDFSVRLWDGSALPPDSGQPGRFVLLIRHPGALRKMFASPTALSLGEAYVYDDFDVEGDIEAAFHLGEYLWAREFSVRERVRLGAALMKLPARDSRPGGEGRTAAKLTDALHSRSRDRRAVRYHYDVSNEFYQLFLGPRMIYSEAYFGSPDDDLDTAEQSQLERICRALRLQKGERLLDIGCGWGGLMIYAAQNFGVEALGVTLSERQAELAGERIREAGLADRCRVEVRDYRDMKEREGFDKIASVGMVEHVGVAEQAEYFARTWDLLRPGGAFFLSGISRLASEPARRPGSFIEAYVFPDGELAPIYETLRAAEQAGFEVRSSEGMREHYGLTLRHWVRRLESHAEQARRLTDEATYRVWRLYMAGSAARFLAGAQNVHQSVLVKLGKHGNSPYAML